MLNKYENSLDTSDCLGNTQQDKILEQEKDTVTPTEHEEIYENDVTPPTGNHIINTVADLLLQPNAVITGHNIVQGVVLILQPGGKSSRRE